MSIVFNVPLEPKGKGRPRFSRQGKFTKVYTDQATLDYESAIQLYASKAMGSQKPLEAPVSVYLYIRVPIPQSYSKNRTVACLSGSERPAKKPDIDNIAKAFLDAMNGTVYLDDTQVVELNIKKVYSAAAGVDVAIMEVE
ncbi:Rus Holliday junction resolvase [uncultured Caudovirales phage]|uniref:Rus Holliday junction resolvase n=1 Tax=uncultured Caudovirales phage TaxID=2100421 RepID=A0A6J5NWV5_9CAUD|nr:Rus Holliday junction resolvase [uncultured Caudovirales phage]